MSENRPRIDVGPDFSRFRDVLLLKRVVKRPPLFDFFVDPSHKAAVLGRPCSGAVDEVEFARRAGYDYVQVSVYSPHRELEEATRAQRQKEGTASHGSNQRIIESREHFRSRAWSWQPAAEGDLSAVAPALDRLQAVAGELAPGMKILLHCADIFTFAWEMMGFDEFCLASVEDPDLIQEIMGGMARANVNILNRAFEVGGEAIGALLYSDDIAYTEGLMLSPDFYRQHLFPTMRKMVGIAAGREAPFIYHSDGRLFSVFDDLHQVGIRGIQPLEPKSMDPLEIKRRWPGQFCLLGNIDLDLMSRGTGAQVEAHVREKIDRLNVGGGYMPGVSNTVPNYVNTENYLRMIETVYSYGD